MSKHFLLVPVGSHGDVNPFVGMGAALKARGHRVTVITNPYFEDLVRKQNLEFIPRGTREDFLRVVHHPDLWHPTRSFELLCRETIVPHLRPMYELIREQFVRGETVVVGAVLALGARVAHDKLGIPFISAHLQPSILRSTIDPPILSPLRFIKRLPSFLVKGLYQLVDWQVDRILAPELNRFRAELGLAPVRRIIDEWWNSPQLILGLFPEWFAPPPPDWPKHLRLTGFPLYDGASLEPVPPDLEDFLAAGPPPVIFTPGSAMSQGSSFFQESVKTCEALGCRGVLLTKFPESVPARLPAHVRRFGYVPFSQVLPRAAAFVHHGGIGTTAQALAAGVPQLVMPLAHDQPDNAARAKNLGVALTIEPRDYQAKNVIPLLQKLLEEPVFRRRAETLRERFRGINNIEETCRLVESI